MRRAAPSLTCCALATVLVACSGAGDEPADETGAPPPPASEEPTTASPSTPPTPAATLPTDVPEDVLLPPEALGSADQPREVDEEVTAWHLPDSCEAPVPEATAMLTLTQGTGEFEEPVGVHQVAAFADADAAASAAAALAGTLTRCAAQDPDTPTTYVLEDVAVGAQGHGLATDYYGASVDGDLDDALGAYLAVTRRGSAVTLAATDGGEGTVGSTREQVVARAAAAWELLCRYDSEGC